MNFNFNFDPKQIKPKGNETKTDLASTSTSFGKPLFNFSGINTNADSVSKPAALAFPAFSFTGNDTKVDSSSKSTFSTFFQKLTFNFGTGKEFQAEKKEFAPTVFKQFNFGGFGAPAKEEENEAAEEPEEAENAFDETAETGEENEECCLDTPCALYQLVAENKSEEEKKSGDSKPRWAERGIGDLHFNHSQEQNFYRIIFRRKPLRNVILNQRISKDMKPKRLNQKSICFIGTLLQSEVNQKESNDPPAITPLFLRFKDAATADRFMELYEEATNPKQ